MQHDPAAELTPALYGTLRTRWNSWQNAVRTGPESLVNTTKAALDLTLAQCNTALGEPAEPLPVVAFKLEYPDE